MTVGSVAGTGYSTATQTQSATKIKELQRQIQELQDKISQVNANEEYDTDTKTAMVSQYQTQITTLQSQITSLQNQGQAGAAQQAQELLLEQPEEESPGGTGLFEPGQFYSERA